MTEFKPAATEETTGQPAWTLEVRRPGPALRGIAGELAGYRESAQAPVRRRELPEAHIVMIFNLGDPLRVAQPGVGGEIVIPPGAGFLAGLHETYTLTETRGQQEGLEVRLSPTGAYRLFGTPMSELANRTLLLDDLASAWSRTLADQLLHTPDWETRLRLAEQALMEKPHCLKPDPQIVWAWRQLRRSCGRLPVSALVAELGWSHSRLVSRFREQIGVTPKQGARLLRFQQVVRRPTFAPGADWCAVAQACGFYDQSHLIREVRAFAGDTPEGLARRRLTASAGYDAGTAALT
ncbi:MAG: AraC family transcriptional regulator [Thermomicrobiales bacterium]|nr:AraC family transcriptional regulator [Thermomicrobiales bacterium]